MDVLQLPRVTLKSFFPLYLFNFVIKKKLSGVTGWCLAERVCRSSGEDWKAERGGEGVSIDGNCQF